MESSMAAKRSNAKSTSSVKKSPGKKPAPEASSGNQKAGKPAAVKAAKAPAKAKAAKPAATKAPAKAKAATKAPAKAKAATKAPAKAKAAKAKAAKPAAANAKAPAKAAPAAKAPAAPPVETGLGVGDSVPAFELPDQDGTLVSSASLAGKPYVIYFYPKDDTPGCTKEACGFQAEQAAFEGAGVRVIGVSPDSPASHTRFRTKYGLGFTLLSDADKSLAQAFGVWVMKQNYGRQYMGIQRSTFLVDASGVVTRVWRNVKVNGHVEAVLGSI